jgi:hypothetical protein
MLRIMSHETLCATFGTPAYEEIGGGLVHFTDGWDARQLVRVRVPQLVGVSTFGGRCGGLLRFHREARAQLLAAFGAIEAAGLLEEILTYDGAYMPRLMRGTPRLSRHALGIALDLNAAMNPFHRPPAAPGTRGALQALVPIFERFGFAWGGYWSPPDGMHFEVAQLLTVEECRTRLLACGATGRPQVTLVVDGVPQPVTLTLRDGVSYAPLGALAATIDAPVVARHRRKSVPVAQFFLANGYAVAWDAAGRAVRITKEG